MGPAEMLTVELAYSPGPRLIELLKLQVPSGTTVSQALELSGLTSRLSDISGQGLVCGLWGRLCDPSQVVKHNDRIEVYRPLLVDPKEARRQRHAQHQAQFGRRSKIVAQRR